MKRGKLFIYNVYFFRNSKKNRKNSENDVKALTKTFEGMNASVEDLSDDKLEHIKKGARALRNDGLSDLQRLQQKIKNRITNQDFKGYDYVAFAVLSHGNADGKVILYNETCSLEETFLEPLIMNDSLANKLKWVISGCCRGSFKESTYTPFSKNMQELQIPDDNYLRYILSFATTESSTAIRLSNGNLFIQTLCSILDQLKESKDLLTILNRVGKIVDLKRLPEKNAICQTTSSRDNFGFYTFCFYETEERFVKKKNK